MIGKHIQNYEITAHLGEGGMGTVYKAGDQVLGRQVALKMLHATLLQQASFLERFKKEARVLAQLLHPNIAVIYNMIEQDNNYFMVMEYVEGKNLDDLMKQHRMMSYKIVVPIFLQALEGLRHAHKKGIFHRDIKPANLILTPEGTVKLMDFGIAKIAGEQRLTQVNRVVGTIEYMAPELIEGKDPSIASDIYAVGITMYEMLTGRLPFENNTDYNLMQEILKKKPLAPEKMNASVPKALNNIVLKAIEKNPQQRFTDAKEFQQALLNAFPDLKFTDLSVAYETQPVQYAQPVQTKLAPKATAIQSAKALAATKMVQPVRTITEKILKKENRIYLLAFLFILVVTVVLVLLPGHKPDVIAQNQNNQQTKILSDTSTKKTEEHKQEKQEEHYGPPDPPVNNYVPVVTDTITREKNKPVEKGKDEKKKTEDKKKEEKKPVEDKKDPAKKEIVVVPVEDKKTDPPKPPVEEKKSSMHTVRLSTSPEVNLYLREAIDPNTAQSGQALYFTVTNSVRYDGEIIIEKGAVAKGKIKSMGNKKISIVITSVTAANGQALPVDESELSGRISEMVNSRSYSVSLKKGVTINF